VRLLDELRKPGFIPDGGGGWVDFTVRDGVLSVPYGTVRVVTDDNVVVVCVMTGNGVVLCDVRLSDGTPLSVVMSAIDQAIAHVVIVRAVTS
jgi:hypothetical protein